MFLRALQVTAALSLLSCATAQCTLPTALMNGNGWVSTDGVTFYLASSSTGAVNVAGTNYTVTCDGTTASNSESYGRLEATVFGSTVYVGFCFYTSSGSSNLLGFGYRTSLNAIPTVGQLNAKTGATGSPTTASFACDLGSPDPALEHVLADWSGGSITPISCPAVLQQNFTNFVVDPQGTPQCGNAAHMVDGMTNTNRLMVAGTGCTPATTFFGSGTPSLYCARSFSIGSNLFVYFADQTTPGATFRCASYSLSGTKVTMSVVSGICHSNQTSTVATGGIIMEMTFTLPTSAPGGGGSGAPHQAVISSLLLLFCALRLHA